MLPGQRCKVCGYKDKRPAAILDQKLADENNAVVNHHAIVLLQAKRRAVWSTDNHNLVILRHACVPSDLGLNEPVTLPDCHSSISSNILRNGMRNTFTLVPYSVL
jgi:hypothetical protein